MSARQKGLTAFATAEAWFEGEVSRAADQWCSTANRLAMGGAYPPFYLYFLPSTEKQNGALYMVPECPEDAAKIDPLWQLGDPQPYRSNLTRAQVRARLWAVARRLPLHAFGKGVKI